MLATRLMFVVASSLSLGLALSGHAVAQEVQPTTEPTATNTAGEVQRETLAPTTVMLLPVTGSYDQHPARIAELAGQVMPAGLGRGAPFGVYYNTPDTAATESELSWAVGIPVDPSATAEPPFEVHLVAERQVATVTCTGPYEGNATCYGPVFAWIEANAMQIVGPTEEHWLSDPETTPPAEIQTKIVVPVAPL